MTSAQMKKLETIIAKIEVLQHQVKHTDENRVVHERLNEAKNALMRVWR